MKVTDFVFFFCYFCFEATKCVDFRNSTLVYIFDGCISITQCVVTHTLSNQKKPDATNFHLFASIKSLNRSDWFDLWTKICLLWKHGSIVLTNYISFFLLLHKHPTNYLHVSRFLKQEHFIVFVSLIHIKNIHQTTHTHMHETLISNFDLSVFGTCIPFS